MQLSELSTEDLEKRLDAAKRLAAYGEARDSLAKFIHLNMPDEEFPLDITKSEYDRAEHTELLCGLVEDIYKGTRKRTAVAIPPQHGKTIHLSIFGPAWIMGKNPRARIVVATYNETRAAELGEDFRACVRSTLFKAIFPDFELSTGSESKTAMTTTKRGKIFFVGRGGTITGRTAEYFFVDDPLKDDEEAGSDLIREKLWKWFFSVAYSRGSKRTRMLILHTRWHEDDLIGRLCDPDHTERKGRFRGIAEEWFYLNIPGVIMEPVLAEALGLKLEIPTDPKVIDAFGAKPMVALWAADKDLEFFAQWKTGDADTFNALVMGKPQAEEGDFFKLEDMVEYDIDDLPKDLTMYGASDHAVSEKEKRDYTVAGCIGVCSAGDIWVMPDVTWERMETDKTVEALLYQFKAHRPGLWWMESELISKSFGPFLHKRMTEEKIYTAIDKVPVSKDKRTRARSIQGRMRMRKVRFPRFAPWWPDARSQMLKFPRGANDDFVDFMSHIGMGLMKETGPATRKQDDDNVIRVGSAQWTIASALRRSKQEKRYASQKGW